MNPDNHSPQHQSQNIQKLLAILDAEEGDNTEKYNDDSFVEELARGNSTQTSSTAPNNKPHRHGWYGPPLLGDVAKVTRSINGQIKTIYHFNAKGDVSKLVSWGLCAELWYLFPFMDDEYDVDENNDIKICIYKYNSAGFCIEQTVYNFTGMIDSQTISHYDSTGHKIERVKYSRGNKKLIDTCKYNSTGQLMEEVRYDSNGQETQKQTYHYDPTGKLIEENMYGYWDWKICNNYDSAGNLIEVTEYKADGQLENQSTYTYNITGNVVEQKVVYPDEEKGAKTRFHYDSSGKLIEETEYNAKGQLENKRIYIYNSAGMLEEYTTYYDEDKSHKFMFRYDSVGNLIEDTEYNADTKIKTTTYRIKYR